MSVSPKLGMGLGRLRDFHDSRDYILSYKHLGIDAPLPLSADVFVSANPPIRSQGPVGACTAFSSCTFREWLAMAFPKYSTAFTLLSPLWFYYQERLRDGDVGQDQGSTLRTACKVMTSTGVEVETKFPYDPSGFASSALSDTTGAAPFKAGAYHRVPDVQTLKSVLASGYAALLGFTVYESFYEIGSNGIMPMPAEGEQILGGHAVCIRGYSDTINEGSFRIRNSWGEAWGLGGDFLMPYRFLEAANISQWDCYTIHLGKPWAA